jgi:hypothetical protein
VPHDAKVSFQWIARAATGGHIEAQYELATLYFLGVDIKRDLVRAYIWYHYPARDGYRDAAKKQVVIKRSLNRDQRAELAELMAKIENALDSDVTQ